MNLTISTGLNAQPENNDLRELSCEEKNVASGGAACYRNPVGTQNLFRYVSSGNGAFEQKFSGGSYRNTRFFSNIGNFGAFCKRGGFTVFA
jgi:hypothetical protein